MKIFKKILLGLGILLCCLLLFLAFIYFGPTKTYEAVPYPELVASTDSLVLARGEHLTFGPAHCYGCHSQEKDSLAIKRGEKVAFAGGRSWDTPLGIIRIPNITPDLETGIGKLTNAQIEQSMRNGIRPHGTVMLPVMPFTHMSESDMTAIISYLRAQPSVKNKVAPHDYSFLGKVATRFMLKPLEVTEPIPKHKEPEATITYGEYLANDVAGCINCHTKFNMKTMAYEGSPYAGGMEMVERIHTYHTPNLTPDPATGIMHDWTEEQFLTRFRGEAVYEDTPMAWKAFAKMTDLEIQAIYRYLMSLDPVENDVGPIMVFNN